MPLNLSAKEDTGNKKCVLCDNRLTPQEREAYTDMCMACVMDAVDTDTNDD